MDRSVAAALVIAGSAVILGASAAPETHPAFIREKAPTTKSERYADFPAILLPESAAPALPAERSKPGQHAEIVFAFVVDTLGRIELETVETLAASDSSVARSARSNLGGIRYIPARIVLDVGHCVEFNGNRGHCGGPSPTVRKLRSRVVLRINASTPPA